MINEVEDTPPAVSFLCEPGALVEGLRLGGAGVWRWKIDSEQLEWTKNLESVHHLPPGAFDGTLSSFQRDLHPDDAAGVWQKIAESIQTGTPYQAVYRTAPRPGVPDLWIETSGGVVAGPEGSRYLTGVCLDVSERVRKEQALKRSLDQQRAVARFGTFALSESKFSLVLDGAVQVAAEVLDVPLTKILQFSDSADHLVLRAGVGWAEGLVGHGEVGIERQSQAGYTLLVNEPVIVRDLLEETRFSGPPLLHDYKVRSGISVVIPGAEQRPFGVFGIHTCSLREFDRTDAEFVQSLANIVAQSARQVAAADHQSLLVREMAHRAGNMMQLISSIASQTFNASADPQLAKKSFSERLGALARSNYIVSRGGWTSTRFTDLAQETLAPFGDRVAVEGRDILLPPELCFDLGLVLHELVSNSLKYGTLGREEGAVSAKWHIEGRSGGTQTFCFEWADPFSPSSSNAKGGGFGSRLVSALVEHKWKGEVSVERGSHFRTRLEIPL